MDSENHPQNIKPFVGIMAALKKAKSGKDRMHACVWNTARAKYIQALQIETV